MSAAGHTRRCGARAETRGLRVQRSGCHRHARPQTRVVAATDARRLRRLVTECAHTAAPARRERTPQRACPPVLATAFSICAGENALAADVATKHHGGCTGNEHSRLRRRQEHPAPHNHGGATSFLRGDAKKPGVMRRRPAPHSRSIRRAASKHTPTRSRNLDSNKHRRPVGDVGTVAARGAVQPVGLRALRPVTKRHAAHPRAPSKLMGEHRVQRTRPGCPHTSALI